MPRKLTADGRSHPGRTPGVAWIRFDLDADDLKAIGHHFGKKKPATLTEARSFLYANGLTLLDDVLHEWRTAKEAS
jgi:hypothetical protein